MNTKQVTIKISKPTVTLTILERKTKRFCLTIRGLYIQMVCNILWFPSLHVGLIMTKHVGLAIRESIVNFFSAHLRKDPFSLMVYRNNACN
jgi:hypothetical protein